jgi:hypothetical protein
MTTRQERVCSRTDRVVVHCLLATTVALLIAAGATGIAASAGLLPSRIAEVASVR